MFTLHVCIARRKQFYVLLGKIFKSWHRNKVIAPEVSHFILDIAFFPAGLRIHEDGFEAIMLFEPGKAFCYGSAATFNDFCDNSTGVVEPDFSRHSTCVFKHGLQSFQQTFHIFTVIELQVTAIAVRKTENKMLSFILMAIFIEYCQSKISLSFTWLMN